MTVHLVKLCVGADTIEDLAGWIARRLAERRRRGEPAEHYHTTRMMPRRHGELLNGGSLYWVVRGAIQCRQLLVDIRPVSDDKGVRRCRIVLDPALVPVVPRPRGPFQGWRYLRADEAPPDLGPPGDDGGRLPADLRRELAMLGLS